MMQGMMLIFLTILLPSLSYAGNHFNVLLPGGNMRFQGNIIAEACRVEGGDKQMTVEIGRISSNRLLSVGQDTAPVSFDVKLQDCNTHVKQQVGVAFMGISDKINTTILSIGEGEGIAQGIGIALFDSEGRQILINTPPKNWLYLNPGQTHLHFIAKYRATDKHITGGIANSQAWFSLTYL